MHAVFLADLAAVVSQHAGILATHRNDTVATAVTAYWTSTRSRLELWHQVIARYRQAEKLGDSATMRGWWSRHVPVLEEVLISEVLCRVVAAIGVAIDRVRKVDDVAPITRSVFDAHLEARTRVHHLMLFGRGCSVHMAVRLNRLRQGVERWSDSLLGRMMLDSDIALAFAIDPDRATAFAEEHHDAEATLHHETACWLFNVSMHDMLVRRATMAPALPRSNRRVADSVIRLFDQECFDSFGTVISPWLRNLQINAGQQDRQIVQSAPVESPASRPKSSHHSLSERWYLS